MTPAQIAADNSLKSVERSIQPLLDVTKSELKAIRELISILEQPHDTANDIISKAVAVAFAQQYLSQYLGCGNIPFNLLSPQMHGALTLTTNVDLIEILKLFSTDLKEDMKCYLNLLMLCSGSASEPIHNLTQLIEVSRASESNLLSRLRASLNKLAVGQVNNTFPNHRITAINSWLANQTLQTCPHLRIDDVLDIEVNSSSGKTYYQLSRAYRKESKVTTPKNIAAWLDNELTAFQQQLDSLPAYKSHPSYLEAAAVRLELKDKVPELSTLHQKSIEEQAGILAPLIVKFKKLASIVENLQRQAKELELVQAEEQKFRLSLQEESEVEQSTPSLQQEISNIVQLIKIEQEAMVLRDSTTEEEGAEFSKLEDREFHDFISAVWKQKTRVEAEEKERLRKEKTVASTAVSAPQAVPTELTFDQDRIDKLSESCVESLQTLQDSKRNLVFEKLDGLARSLTHIPPSVKGSHYNYKLETKNSSGNTVRYPLRFSRPHGQSASNHDGNISPHVLYHCKETLEKVGAFRALNNRPTRKH